MNIKSNYKYLLSDLTALKGVGVKTTNLLKKKNINNLFDLLWKLPKNYTDRSLSSKITDLKIGEVQTITIVPQKYNFPRVEIYLIEFRVKTKRVNWTVFFLIVTRVILKKYFLWEKKSL